MPASDPDAFGRGSRTSGISGQCVQLCKHDPSGVAVGRSWPCSLRLDGLCSSEQAGRGQLGPEISARCVFYATILKCRWRTSVNVKVLQFVNHVRPIARRRLALAYCHKAPYLLVPLRPHHCSPFYFVAMLFMYMYCRVSA